jgi:hypothetical protein
MATILHLVGDNGAGRALPVMARQVAAGDAVTVAVVGGGTTAWPAGLTVRRVPAELPWDQLLDLIFAADQTFSW